MVASNQHVSKQRRWGGVLYFPVGGFIDNRASLVMTDVAELEREAL